jgi:hypothetical protein
MHHAEILFVHMFRDNLVIYPFLTNLEDEISVKGVGFVNPNIPLLVLGAFVFRRSSKT